MFKVFTIDPTPLKEQLVKMIEGCMEAALKQTKEVLDGVPQRSPQQPVKAGLEDIAGMREQIKANSVVLLPILRPETATGIRRAAAAPEVHVIVSGEEALFKASVMYGNQGNAQMTMFIYGNKASTASRALEKLMGVTMSLMSSHVVKNKNFDETYVNKVKGGGYAASCVMVSPTTPDSAVFWTTPPSAAVPSSTFPTNISFGSTISTENGSERAYISMMGGSGLDGGNPLGLTIPSATGSFHGGNVVNGKSTGVSNTSGIADNLDATDSLHQHLNNTGRVPFNVRTGSDSHAHFNSNGISDWRSGFYADGFGKKAGSIGVDGQQKNAGMCGSNIRMNDNSSNSLKTR